MSASQPNPFEYQSYSQKEDSIVKIQQLEQYLNHLKELGNGENYLAEEANITDTEQQIIHFYYFIGRLNPPHEGHIEALITLIKMANEKGCKPLILLGSGPKQKDGNRRTLDDPITFETKKEVIESILQRKGISPAMYEMKEMESPAGQVSEYIREGLEGKDISSVSITLVAGGKDDDPTKLAFTSNAAVKTATSLKPEANINSGVEIINPVKSTSGSSMSATAVRKSAYKTIINGTNFEGWPEEYKQLYGDNSKNVYDEIIEPIQKIPEGDRNQALQEYIENGKLPVIITKGTKRKSTDTATISNTKGKKLMGGKLTRKTRKTRKTRNNKNIRKTQNLKQTKRQTKK